MPSTSSGRDWSGKRPATSLNIRGLLRGLYLIDGEVVED